MATATAMYKSGKNPLRRVTYKSELVESVKDPDERTLHKAFLRYHDVKNWPLLRGQLKQMGRSDLIGEGHNKLLPANDPNQDKKYKAPRRKNSATAHARRKRGKMVTQHTGLPPRDDGNQTIISKK